MEELSRRNDEFAGGGSFAEYWEYNEGLHRQFLHFAGNEMLLRMAEQTRTLTYHYHLQAQAQGDPHSPVSISLACSQHHAIIQAVLDGDAGSAEALMRNHVQDNGASILAFVESNDAVLSPLR